MQFKSPSTWISKTGSIRRAKRGALEAVTGSKRYTSDPITAHSEDDIRSPAELTRGRVMEPSRAESELAAIFHPPSQQRQSSSPNPPLRHSPVHRGRVGSSTLVGHRTRPETISANSVADSIRVNSNSSHPRTLERSSTVGSSEYHRGFTSGEDDDTDAKTDTPFDSLRTIASGRKRTTDSPLESMFDESPPSSAGINNKPKRLSIQEILGPAFDGGSRITEEDESSATPVRSTYDDAETRIRFASFDEDGTGLSGTSATHGRLSFDDDDDLDWARDTDEPIYNHLSPPSSNNSRKGSPHPRAALASISGNGQFDGHQETNNERPRSNIFDWVEPSHHDKPESHGQFSRPKTVHGKQELDMRGGRSASRKGPVATHVRSQSVPVVQDPADNSKPAPKFGTWGLSTKNVSEDWDDDFEFEEELEVGPAVGKQVESRLSMIVPVSIQATQPTVKAHSSQIRELSLLVNDLKRLCRLGREMNMLGGSSTKLWREAEGIIALASPDEDGTDAGLGSPTTGENGDVDISDASSQLKLAVVKERPVARRRSVFSPDDNIFGNRAQIDDLEADSRPKTPEQQTDMGPYNPSSVARSVMETMQLRWRQPGEEDEDEEDDLSHGRLNFDTNSLRELVKRAGDLRDLLADQVRKAEHITNSPVRTPRRDRGGGKNPDGSPAFTRVFDDPASSPSRRLQNSHNHGSKSPLNEAPANSSPSTALSQRLQMMTVG
jgi:hypothetical protein